ncbi:MAG: class III signal peptide-containing protein, partial [Candidatus Omnitrophica bacterium]|nr:class III signal peptide-containing protein [Candidatus Omnitrophota bacterium]
MLNLMFENRNKIKRKAQAAVEYLLLLAVVVSVVMIGMKRYFPRAHTYTETYYNYSAMGVMGQLNPC